MTLGNTGNRIIAREDDLAHRRAGTCVETASERHEFLGRVELWVQQLIKLCGIDTRYGFLTGDEALFDHLDGDTERGRRGALAHTGLEHPELSLLDGELDVAHVPVVFLKRHENALELRA